MSKNVIFCYSGSGNCLDIAKNIAKRLGDTDIVMMRAEPEVKDVRGAKRVGFVFPCYAGGLPGDVEKFVSELRVDPESYTFGVVCYAGYPGVGMAKIHDIVPLDYWAGITHQCSCIWLMPHNLMLPPLDAEKAQARSEKLAAKIADDILYVKHLSGRPLSNPVNALEAKAWPMLSGKKAAKMTVTDSCVGCGQCARLCPRGNISIVNGRASIGTNCIGCLSCLQYCPKQRSRKRPGTLPRLTVRPTRPRQMRSPETPSRTNPRMRLKVNPETRPRTRP